METGYFTAGVVLMYIQSWLKRFGWYKKFVTAFPAADKYVHRMVAGLGSFLTAVGITYTAQGDWATGYMIGIAIPSGPQLLEAVWAFVNVFVSQQVAYDATRRPAVMPHDLPASTAKP